MAARTMSFVPFIGFAMLLAIAGARAEPDCQTTVGSPLSTDCAAVAQYLLSLGTQQCTRTQNIPGDGDCQPLHTVGTCVASICGTLNNGISCTDAGDDVATLATECASGDPGKTVAAGSQIPYGNGNLRIQISQRAS